jgi:hypothetical protein
MRPITFGMLLSTSIFIGVGLYGMLNRLNPSQAYEWVFLFGIVSACATFIIGIFYCMEYLGYADSKRVRVNSPLSSV